MQINSINDVCAIKHLGVKELKLTGNPLCDCEEINYVTGILNLLPTLEFLVSLWVLTEIVFLKVVFLRMVS